MNSFEFGHLVDMEQVRQLLQSHHALSGMGYSILDEEGQIPVAVGWQEICTRFHRLNPATLARCRESDAYIKTHLHDFDGNHIEYRCKNGLVDVAMPIIIEGRHVATFFTGQFFYDDERPDPDHFRAQAEAFGFDVAEYGRALDQVPVLNREYVRRNVEFLHNMVRVMAETGLKNLRLARETEVRRRTEERLSLMSFALDHIREAAYLLDEQGDLRYVNNEACRALGYERRELLALWVGDINPSFSPERWAKHWAAIRAKGSLVMEGYHKTSDERIFPVEVYVTFFEFGGEGFQLALARDTTERRWMETMLRTSEQQFRTLTENSPNAIIRYDRECRRIYVNPAYTRETGVPADLVQNSDLDRRWPAGMNISAREYRARLQQVMESGIPAEILLEWRRPDGQHLISHIFNVVAERDPSGAITGCLAIGHNISGLKEAEFRLARLAETSPGVLFTLLLTPDGNWCLPYVSPRIEELNGLRPEELAGEMFRSSTRIHPDDVSRVVDSIAESARSLVPWQCEFRLRHPARGDIWVEGRFTPESHPLGGTVCSGFLHDITARKQTEEALRLKREQLSSMAVELSLAEERERRRIASELHDHIGQLLLLSRIKLGSLATTLDDSGDEGTFHEIQALLEQTTRDVRSLTQQLHPPLLASAGLEAALEWLAKRMEVDYSLQVNFSDDGSSKSLSEDFRAVVFHAARELLINVAKYARTSQARLSVGREADVLTLTVADGGVGFDCPPGGDGDAVLDGSFGLFNIRQRMRHLGGELLIQSAPGCGTRVTIRVPLAEG